MFEYVSGVGGKWTTVTQIVPRHNGSDSARGVFKGRRSPSFSGHEGISVKHIAVPGSFFGNPVNAR